jgi:hypothetical protein
MKNDCLTIVKEILKHGANKAAENWMEQYFRFIMNIADFELVDEDNRESEY